jgi:hypothetical protein
MSLSASAPAATAIEKGTDGTFYDVLVPGKRYIITKKGGVFKSSSVFNSILMFKGTAHDGTHVYSFTNGGIADNNIESVLLPELQYITELDKNAMIEHFNGTLLQITAPEDFDLSIREKTDITPRSSGIFKNKEQAEAQVKNTSRILDKNKALEVYNKFLEGPYVNLVTVNRNTEIFNPAIGDDQLGGRRRRRSRSRSRATRQKKNRRRSTRSKRRSHIRK